MDVLLPRLVLFNRPTLINRTDFAGWELMCRACVLCEITTGAQDKHKSSRQWSPNQSLQKNFRKCTQLLDTNVQLLFHPSFQFFLCSFTRPALFALLSSFILEMFITHGSNTEFRTRSSTIPSQILISFHLTVLQLHFSSYILFALIFFF